MCEGEKNAGTPAEKLRRSMGAEPEAQQLKRPTRLAICRASASFVATPPSGCRMSRRLSRAIQRSRSSASSIASGCVPQMRTLPLPAGDGEHHPVTTAAMQQQPYTFLLAAQIRREQAVWRPQHCSPCSPSYPPLAAGIGLSSRAFCSAVASFSGVWPPNCTMMPSGRSFSITLSTSSTCKKAQGRSG